jgi:hypothetical protein
VYSVALLACEMLTGRVALQGDDVVQFGFSSANPAQRPTPRFLGAPISDPMEAVFAKALAVRPEDRFQHAGEFLEGVERGLPSPAHAAPSPSLEFAATVLVPIGNYAASPATTKPEPPSPTTMKPEPPSPTTKPEPPSPTTKPEPPPPKEAKSGVGSSLFILVVLVGGLVGYSTTDIRGASEVRKFFSPVVRLVRKEAAQQLPKLRQKTRQVVDNAADILAREGGQAGAVPECPPGTRRVTSLPVHKQDASTGFGEHGPIEPICVDEHLVSEKDYRGCAVCEQPRLDRSRGKRKPRAHAEFCVDGKTPTTGPIRCVTWKQAEIYCAAQAARLPAPDELRALAPTLILAPMEWTSATPRVDREKRGPFRCAHGQ